MAMILPGLGRVQRGAETAFLEVARALNSFPDVDVVLFGTGDDVPAGLSIRKVRCVPREKLERLPRMPVFRSECHYEEYSFVRQLKRGNDFDPHAFDAVIHCTYPFVNWYVQKCKRRNPKLLSIFVTQNGDWMCRAMHREYRWFACDGLIAINPDYYANNRQRHRTILIPNGTDPVVFTPRTQTDEPFKFQAPIPPGHTVVLMASALIESKRVAEGVEAAAKVDNAYFIVAGDGPKRDEIARLAKDLMPGRYQLLGSVPRDQMASLFRQADVFLHMSKVEPFGIVYLEAAACGLPVVTHDGETPRWILGDTALYADTDNVHDVADAIQMATDPQLREILGEAARDRVIEDWTWIAQGRRYRKFIRGLLGMETELPSTVEETLDAVDYHRELQHS